MNKARWPRAGGTDGHCGDCTFPAGRPWVVAAIATLVSCQRGHVQSDGGLAGEVSSWRNEAGEASGWAGEGSLLERPLCLCRGPCPSVSFSPPQGQPGAHSQIRPQGWRVAGASGGSIRCQSLCFPTSQCYLIMAVPTSFPGATDVTFLVPNGETPRGCRATARGRRVGGESLGRA